MRLRRKHGATPEAHHRTGTKMDEITASSLEDDGAVALARPTSRRSFLAVGAAAVLAAGAGATVFVTQAGPFAAKQAPTTAAFTGATDTITRGTLQGETTVAGTLRFSDAHKLKAGFDGILVQLPASGTVLTQGDVLYRTGDRVAYLMHGSLPAWRTFEIGMERGEDVRQLETLLKGMGYFDYEPDDRFTWATTSAIVKWQKDVGLARTGTIPLGQMVFSPGDLRVGSVAARVGDRVADGTDLYDVTSTTQVIDANVKLGDQKLAVVGSTVTVKLPDATTTPGTITAVGTPTEKSTGSSETKERVIPITITLTDASAAANFQEASVTVALPSEKRENVLSVPVGALLALSPDQYGVEVVEDDGTTRKVPVTLGLFAGGRVEISGEGLSEGQRVVVPQT